MLSQINGESGMVEPATNIGEFDYRRYYAAKKINQRIKFTSTQMNIASVSFIDKLHQLRFILQNYFKTMPQLLGFLPVN